MGTERTLYVSTSSGAFRASGNGRGWSADDLGLPPTGGMRAAVVADKDNPRVLFAGTSRAGAFRSADGGASWREMNHGLVYKDVWSLAQHPTSGVLYAGASPTSVFRSLDGETWEPCERLWSLPSTRKWHGPNPPHLARLKGLGLAESDPDLVYGAIEEGWLLRSRDGGASWDQLDQGVEFDSHTVHVMPDDTSTIVATTGNGLYRSEDGGESFERVDGGLGHSYTVSPVLVHPTRPKVLFTAMAATPPPGWRRPEGGDCLFVRSEDQGKSWTASSGGLPRPIAPIVRGLAGEPSDPDTIFAGMSDGTLWRSTDGGESFERLLEGLPPVTAIAVAPAG